MCFFAYMASSKELPEVEWKEDSPGFFVKTERENEFAKRVFEYDYVYYLGSAAGCGCGFFIGCKDLDSLKTYLRKAYQANGPIEIMIGEIPSANNRDFERLPGIYEDRIAKYKNEKARMNAKVLFKEGHEWLSYCKDYTSIE